MHISSFYFARRFFTNSSSKNIPENIRRHAAARCAFLIAVSTAARLRFACRMNHFGGDLRKNFARDAG
jgi:hypothetical protein